MSHGASPSPSLPVAARPGLWRRIAGVLAGEEHDYTRGSLRRGVVLLAVPMMLEMAMEAVFGVVDVFFVARLGAAAVATVGLTEAVLTLVFAVAIGLSVGTTAMVARRVGEGDLEAAAVAAVIALGTGLVASAAVGAVGILAAPELLAVMGASPEVVAVGGGYTAILLGGSASVVLLFLGNAIFRGAGDAAIAMRVLWLANGLNILLDPCLIFGLGPFPELGLAGAAVATTCGRGAGVLYQLVLLTRGRGRLRIEARHVAAAVASGRGVLVRLLRVSAGGISQYLVATGSWLVGVRFLAPFGDPAVAGYTVAVRILLFTILPAWGLANAAATLVGQNLGAGRPDRAERSAWLTARYNLAFLGVVEAVFLLVPEPLARIFTADPEVVAVAVSCLRWTAACFVVYAFGLVMVHAMNGAGDTRTPTLVYLVSYWLFQLPLAWLLAFPAGLGPSGVFAAWAAAEVLIGILGVFAFRRGAWKAKTM